MLRFIILAAAVYLAWHYAGWRVAASVAGAYILFLIIVSAASKLTGGVNALGARSRTDRLMHQKLTDEEKAHYATARDHDRAMIDRRAQFDPELRRRSGS